MFIQKLTYLHSLVRYNIWGIPQVLSYECSNHSWWFDNLSKTHWIHHRWWGFRGISTLTLNHMRHNKPDPGAALTFWYARQKEPPGNGGVNESPFLHTTMQKCITSWFQVYLFFFVDLGSEKKEKNIQHVYQWKPVRIILGVCFLTNLHQNVLHIYRSLHACMTCILGLKSRHSPG